MIEPTPEDLSVELKIQQLFAQKESLANITDRLCTDLDWTQLSETQMQSVCSFMIGAGASPTLLNELSSRLEKIKVPWRYFIEALVRVQEKLPQKLEESILAAAEEQSALSELSRSDLLDEARADLKELRAERKKMIQLKAQELREELFQQYEFFKSQNLWDQAENHLLTRIKRIFPADPQLKTELEAVRENQAAEMLNRKPKRSLRHLARASALSAVEKQILDAIALSQVQAPGATEGESPFDFSISHLMWENFDQALEFVENAEGGPSRDWLKAELLLLARRHVDLMEYLRWLESQYSSDSESTFACAFLRAQALWGLGQKFQAQEMLKSVLEFKPDYRTAASLLMEWQEDDE